MTEIDFSDVKKVHFIGIGGIGVSAVARMFLLRGAEVSGSDIAPSAITSELEKLGAHIAYEQSADNVSQDRDLVIYTIAIPADSPELVRARDLGIVLMTYPEVLGLISRSHRTIAVAGTHGKTTTTAMTAEALLNADLDPTVIVGSLLKSHQSNFIPGNSDWFLVEACEYRESFRHLSPEILVITNIEADHLDYYHDLDHIIKAFNALIKKVPKDGCIITDPKNGNIARALEGASARVVDYNDKLDEVEIAMPGQHNKKNASASLSVVSVIGLDEEKAKEALSDFSGTWRRFEKKGVTESGALLYDDYAHHPTEIRATLSGAREAFPDKDIIAVFQPHLFSRTKELLSDFADSFSQADKLVLLPIYAARESFDPSISHEVLADRVSNVKEIFAVSGFEEAREKINEISDANSVIFTLGAGDVYRLALGLVSVDS